MLIEVMYLTFCCSAEINQMWTVNATVNIFIHYHNPETQSSVCESQEDLKYEDSFTKELICYDGWTDVGLFVYFDDELSIDECDECHPPSSDVDNVIAYYFEVSCDVFLLNSVLLYLGHSNAFGKS
jgi:hypothetical protein